MSRLLPTKPNLEHLKKQAKDLLKAHKRGDADACKTLRLLSRFAKASDEEILAADVALHEAQYALAMDYGFKSWPAMKAHVQQLAEAKSSASVNVEDEFKKRGNKAADDIAGLAARDNAVLEEVLRGATSANKKIKNAAGKTLQVLSETDPARLYPKFDFFIDLIDGEDTILKWIAIDVVGNLAPVDVDKRIDQRVVAKFAGLLSDSIMITAAHAVESLGKIAAKKPEHRDRITAALLKVDSVERDPECRNILAGKKILALGGYFDVIDDKNRVLVFVQSHSDNSRSATRKKAADFLKKFQTKQ